MALTNAEKQKAWREARKARVAQAQKLADKIVKRSLKGSDVQMAADAKDLAQLLKEIT